LHSGPIGFPISFLLQVYPVTTGKKSVTPPLVLRTKQETSVHCVRYARSLSWKAQTAFRLIKPARKLVQELVEPRMTESLLLLSCKCLLHLEFFVF